MRAWLSSLKVQLVGLILLVVGSGLYGLADGQLSLWTPDQLGHRLFEEADYGQAASRFIDPMWQGVAQFRAGEFDKAASLFSGYDTAEAAFNQGNALVMQGKYEAAVGRFARALELQPGWEDATVNRKIALARAEALKKEGGDMTGGKIGADEIDHFDGYGARRARRADHLELQFGQRDLTGGRGEAGGLEGREHRRPAGVAGRIGKRRTGEEPGGRSVDRDDVQLGRVVDQT